MSVIANAASFFEPWHAGSRWMRVTGVLLTIVTVGATMAVLSVIVCLL